MYPVYRSMDSYYPHLGNQMPCAHPYYPRFEAVPPQMKMDVAQPPVTHESWPQGGFYGYSVPGGCHGCCNHNCFPGYYGFKPHYPPPPSSQFYHHGSYPPFPETSPVHYPPPPHYSVEHPRYEYDKNGPTYHCSECPNHLCNRKNSNVKIEEQDPDVEKKSSDSIFPIESNNYPYPVVYIPPGYMKNREHRKATEVEMDREEDPHDANSPRSMKSSGQDPSVWSRWFPLDINSLGSLKHVGDEKRTQYQRNEDSSQLPFPVFWMPYKPDEVERKAHKEDRESVEESRYNFRITPVAPPDNEDGTGQPGASKDDSGSEVGPKMMDKNSNQKLIPVKQLEQHEGKGTSEDAKGKSKCIPVMDKNANQKLIPVKQLEQHEGKGTSEDAKGRSKCIPVKHVANGGESEPSENSTERQSSSPKKASKLPPVCLRVDPLPRRKNGKGSSRSPSPPGHKGTQELSSDSYKSSTFSGLKENAQKNMLCTDPLVNKAMEAEPNKKVKEVVGTSEGIGQDGKENSKAHTLIQVADNLPVLSHEEVSTNQSTTKGSADYGVCIVEEDKESNKEDKISGEAIELKDALSKSKSGDGKFPVGEDEGTPEVKEEQYEKANNAERKNWSEAEAAVIIQSAYRGFEVRRWEPLKKLKQIAQVREKVTEVRSRIQALESSSDSYIDDRQKMVIGETIMSLLLKLDTIQGLHARVRDIRKSVAKELVSLQEKLDSLSISNCEAYATKPVEDSPTSTANQDCIQEQQVEAKDEGLDDSEGNNDKMQSVEPCQGHPLGTIDAISGDIAAETSEVSMVGKGVCQESGDKHHEFPLVKELAAPVMKLNDKENIEVVGICQEVMSEMQNWDDSMLEQSAELPAAVEERHIHVEKKGGLTCEDSQGGEVGSNVAIDVIQPDKGAANMNMVEQKPHDAFMAGLVSAEVEEKVGSAKDGEFLDNDGIEPKEVLDEAQCEKVSSSEPMEVAKVEEHKVGSKKSDELPGDTKLDVVKFIVPSLGEVGNVEGLGEASNPQECQPELSLLGNNIHDGEQREDNGVIDEKSLGLGASRLDGSEPSRLDGSQPKFPILDNKINDGELGTETVEEVLVATQSTPSEAEQLAAGIDKIIDESCGTEYSKEEVLLATPFTPSGEEQAREGELSSLSPTVNQVSLGSDMGLENDRMLIEENERLREMMEKLIEAGKQQLTTISDLTGRVKDLERKLSRKKKSKTRRSRVATSRPSCLKLSTTL